MAATRFDSAARDGNFHRMDCVTYQFFHIQYLYVTWTCPRCGNQFHWKQYRFGRNINPFASRCLHCGLPKWAETDPDPALKQKLDPFRTDKILGLGNTRRL